MRSSGLTSSPLLRGSPPGTTLPPPWARIRATTATTAGGEDNGDAHLKNMLVHHQVIVPITGGKLDLGPWQAIFYVEFDGQRNKRLVIKAIGE